MILLVFVIFCLFFLGKDTYNISIIRNRVVHIGTSKYLMELAKTVATPANALVA